MKILESITTTTGEEIAINRRITSVIFYDCQTEGAKALNRIKNIIKECEPESAENVAGFTLRDNNYYVFVEMPQPEPKTTKPGTLKTIKDIKPGEFFKLVNKSGEISAAVYLKSHYNREDKTYTIYKAEDVSAWRIVKSSQKVYTDFIY